MSALPVIAVFDVGKTNKKLFLFDENYNIVFERSARFMEMTDEDGFPCENLEALRSSVFSSINEVANLAEFNIKAINFSAYGASLVYVDGAGEVIAPLYNYLKPYPADLQKLFYDTYGGEEEFSRLTASPVLGSLNSGLQLYRFKHEKQESFARLKYALHLPQYLSSLLSGKYYSDITSIGCHTGLWNFDQDCYHNWLGNEELLPRLAPILPAEEIFYSSIWGRRYAIGTGLHDSSAALIPYLMNFKEPFLLLSTGTWCISLNPFNQSPLTAEELEQDCLCYLQYDGKPVKASRVFAGNEYDEQVKRIAEHFNQSTAKYRSLTFSRGMAAKLAEFENADSFEKTSPLGKRDLSSFKNDEDAYQQLMVDLVVQQKYSANLILKDTPVKRIFVDGGFSKNEVYMNLLAAAFPGMEVYAASMAQASALGAALAIHDAWNDKALPNDLIALKYYSGGAV